jgi:hypothetical protein
MIEFFSAGLLAVLGIGNPGKRFPIRKVFRVLGKPYQNGSHDHEFTLSSQEMRGSP